MKKLLATAAAVAGIMFAGAAGAATVDINLTQQAAGSTSWNLTVDNHSTTFGVGALNLLVTGLTTYAVNTANTAIDNTGLSGLTIDPIGDGVHNFLVVNNAAAGLSIVPTTATGVLLGVLTGPACTGVPACLAQVSILGSEDLLGQPSLFDQNGNALDPALMSFHVDPVAVAPEPGSVMLLGIALGGIALIRRRA